MSLKYRISIIFSLLTILFLVVDYSIQRLVILPTYLALEKAAVIQNLDRAIEAIHREIEHVNIICYDWASWDDTYRFVLEGSEAYEKSNLSFSTFKTNGLNLIYFCDLEGNLVWHATYDVTNDWEIRITNILESAKVKAHLLTFPKESNRYKKGLLNTNHGIMMLASRPILPSSDKGSPRGTLILGKLLDSALIEKLTSQTRVPFHIISLHDDNVRQQYRSILSKITPHNRHFRPPDTTPHERGGTEATREIFYINTHKVTPTTGNDPLDMSLPGDTIQKDPYYIQPIDGNALKGYALMEDIEDDLSLLISLKYPRAISKQGIKTIHFAIFYILIVGTVVLILFLLFTNAMILIPLSRLAQLIKKVEETGDFSIRSPVNRKDEIGQLSESFNRMMRRTEMQNEKIETSMKRLEALATIDPLTGLYNRRYFENTIQKEWKRAIRDKTPVSVILCDIDYFKQYNDTYGHQRGDNCLKTVADAIHHSIDRPPDLAARYGGEEFIVLLPNVEIDGALHVAEKMRRRVNYLAIPHRRSKAGAYVTVSLGVATTHPVLDASYELLIDCADKALYRSKDQGRNRVMVF